VGCMSGSSSGVVGLFPAVGRSDRSATGDACCASPLPYVPTHDPLVA
jgi:hypothetical protein